MEIQILITLRFLKQLLQICLKSYIYRLEYLNIEIGPRL